MKRMIFKSPNVSIRQTNALSSLYNSQVYITYGEVESNNTDGTCNVLLINGFITEHIKIPSSVYPSKELGTGGIGYPPKGSQVVIYHPKDDINSGMVYPAPLDYRDDDVKSDLLDQGDKQILPGGWEMTYDQDNGNATFVNGDFSLTVDNDSQEGIVSDWNGHEIQLSPSGVLLKSTDAANWKPNTLAVDPFTGVPHGGTGAGIVKLKGG